MGVTCYDEGVSLFYRIGIVGFITLGSGSGFAHEPTPTPEQAPTQAPTPEQAPTPTPAPTQAPEQAPEQAPAPTQAPAPEQTPAPAPPPLWGAWFSAGPHFFLVEDTRLDNQLAAAGYTLDTMGPALSLSLERYVLDWLIVGGTVDVRWVVGQRDEPGLSSQKLSALEMSFTRIGAGAYVQPTLCLNDRGDCEREGILFGAQLGIATGPTLWTLRDETEVGAFFRFDLALMWFLRVEPIQLGFRIGHAMIWQSDLGPSDLGHPFEWSPSVDLRVGWTW